jgi:translation initiation factor IF-1
MSVNMKNLKNKLRADERRDKKNSRVENEAIDDPSVIFGKTVKTLGGGMFRVAIPHQEHKHELIEVTAKAVDKNMARICLNDVVIIVLSGRNYELKGNVSSKNIKLLAKTQRIHPALVESEHKADDGGFEFVVEEKKEGAEEEEIDISAI